MRELSVAEQRYEAVRAVIADGETVTSVAARFGVSRKTLHVWLARYEAGGLAELVDRSHRPRSCPHQMPATVEVALVRLRIGHPSWGPRRLAFELARQGHVVSESAAYRALARLNLVDPTARRVTSAGVVCEPVTA
jgi:transposase